MSITTAIMHDLACSKTARMYRISYPERHRYITTLTTLPFWTSRFVPTLAKLASGRLWTSRSPDDSDERAPETLTHDQVVGLQIWKELQYSSQTSIAAPINLSSYSPLPTLSPTFSLPHTGACRLMSTFSCIACHPADLPCPHPRHIFSFAT